MFEHTSRVVPILVGLGLVSGCGGSAKGARGAPDAPTSALAVGEVVGSCGRVDPGVGAARYGAPAGGSSVALALGPGSGPGRDRALAYVADADDRAVYTVSLASGETVARTALRGRPEQLLVLADGRVAATLRDRNAVEVLEPGAAASEPLRHRCLAAVPSDPVGLSSTPDGRTLLVTSGWGRALSVLDGQTLARRRSVDLPREPRGVVASDDGRTAYVAHLVGARLSVVDLDERSEPRQIGLGAGVRSTHDRSDRSGCQGFALAKAEGGRLLAPMTQVDPGDEQSGEGYGSPDSELPSELGAVAVVDAGAERLLSATGFEPPARRAAGGDGGDDDGDGDDAFAVAKVRAAGCVLPRAAAYHGGSLFVACQGPDALIEYNGRAVTPANFERRRWSVGRGPSGVAIDGEGGRAVVWSQFSHELAVVPLRGGAPKLLAVAPRAPRPGVDDEFARGRELFHLSGDLRVSADWRACASCHPEGREDALTWSSPDGPRQTPMLAGRLEGTAPFGWSGQHGSLEEHVVTTFQRLDGKGLDRAALGALLTYVRRMPAPVPTEPAPERRALVARGRSIFESSEAGCLGCHGGAGGETTDRATHALTGALTPPRETREPFDTPSLRFVGGTAPYFHDGRYETLEHLLAASDSSMGHTLHLGRGDRRALAAYLETL
jgi:hypothetical protein